MRKIKIENMKNISGGGTNRDCMLRGTGIALGLVAGFAGLVPGFFSAGMLAVTSGHCYE